jgi:hypothetical protein
VIIHDPRKICQEDSRSYFLEYFKCIVAVVQIGQSNIMFALQLLIMALYANCQIDRNKGGENNDLLYALAHNVSVWVSGWKEDGLLCQAKCRAFCNNYTKFNTPRTTRMSAAVACSSIAGKNMSQTWWNISGKLFVLFRHHLRILAAGGYMICWCSVSSLLSCLSRITLVLCLRSL